MRFILDQGVPRDAASALRELGYDCTHVAEVGMATTADENILALAASQNATVVTLDADFHAILAVSRALAPSVIRLRLQGLAAPAVVNTVLRVISAFESDLGRGAMITVKARKTTCHKLPVGGD